MSNTIHVRWSELVHANGALLFIFFFFFINLMDPPCVDVGCMPVQVWVTTQINVKCFFSWNDFFILKNRYLKRADTKSNPK